MCCTPTAAAATTSSLSTTTTGSLKLKALVLGELQLLPRHRAAQDSSSRQLIRRCSRQVQERQWSTTICQNPAAAADQERQLEQVCYQVWKLGVRSGICWWGCEAHPQGSDRVRPTATTLQVFGSDSRPLHTSYIPTALWFIFLPSSSAIVFSFNAFLMLS